MNNPETNIEYLKGLIREVPNFPKAGIIFNFNFIKV